MNSGHNDPSDDLRHDSGARPSCNVQVAGRLPCDAYHHYYHYQASAQYLWLAEARQHLGKTEEARQAYERALFQDHFNAAAKQGMDGLFRGGPGETPSYEKHPETDAAFNASVGLLNGPATVLHDKAVEKLQAGDAADAMALLDEALAYEPRHSNSFFLRGKCHFSRNDFAEAERDFNQAVQLSHAAHNRYHAQASAEHLTRGAAFLARGETDLAVSDFTKALDLDKGNKQARAARAQAYRAKGNERLAQADEGEI